MTSSRERLRTLARKRSSILFGSIPSGTGSSQDYSQAMLMMLLASDGLTVADYDASLGVTGTLNASAVANQIGAAGPLLQATGANQPIILPYTGAKYVYLPAAASNTVTTPTKTITGNFTATFDVALNDYTPAADVTLFGKTSGNDGFQVKWLTTDKVRLVIGDGAGLTNVDVVAASSFTDATQHTVTIVWEDGVGATFKYDGVTSGSQVAAAKTLTNAAVSWTLGSTTSIGKVYDHTMTNSVATTYYHLNPGASAETTTNGATWVSDNGETYTLNSAGAAPAQVVGSPQLLAAGSMFMQATFTANQPVTAYVVMKPTAYSGSQIYLAGTGGNTSLYSTGVGTNYEIYAGSSVATAAGPAAGGFHIFQVQWNGASSFWNVDGGANHAGNAGANNLGGATIGSAFDGTFTAQAQYKEAVFRLNADSASQQTQILGLLRQIYGTP